MAVAGPFIPEGNGDIQQELAGYCNQCGAAIFRRYKPGDEYPGPGRIKYFCEHNAGYSMLPPTPKKVIGRPSVDQYCMGFALMASTMSTCLHRQEGAVAVQGKRIIATGYNGAPSGLPHCDQVGCSRDAVLSGERLDICRAVHAEENVLLQCAQYGPICRGSTIYTTLQPCLGCAKSLVNAGVARVVWMKDYPNRDGVYFLQSAGVVTNKLDECTLKFTCNAI